jgi:hypothetical protein
MNIYHLKEGHRLIGGDLSTGEGIVIDIKKVKDDPVKHAVIDFQRWKDLKLQSEEEQTVSIEALDNMVVKYRLIRSPKPTPEIRTF